MPFGLTGAPATFQRLVDTMLRGIQYTTVLAYIDDIIVIGQDVAECRTNLVDVLERIRKAKLKLKPSKCELFKKKISYLGHVISAAGVDRSEENTGGEGVASSVVCDGRAWFSWILQLLPTIYPQLH